MRGARRWPTRPLCPCIVCYTWLLRVIFACARYAISYIACAAGSRVGRSFRRCSLASPPCFLHRGLTSQFPARPDFINPLTHFNGTRLVPRPSDVPEMIRATANLKRAAGRVSGGAPRASSRSRRSPYTRPAAATVTDSPATNRLSPHNPISSRAFSKDCASGRPCGRMHSRRRHQVSEDPPVITHSPTPGPRGVERARQSSVPRVNTKSRLYSRTLRRFTNAKKTPLLLPFCCHLRAPREGILDYVKPEPVQASLELSLAEQQQSSNLQPPYVAHVCSAFLPSKPI